MRANAEGRLSGATGTSGRFMSPPSIQPKRPSPKQYRPSRKVVGITRMARILLTIRTEAPIHRCSVYYYTEATIRGSEPYGSSLDGAAASPRAGGQLRSEIRQVSAQGRLAQDQVTCRGRDRLPQSVLPVVAESIEPEQAHAGQVRLRTEAEPGRLQCRRLPQGFENHNR